MNPNDQRQIVPLSYSQDKKMKDFMQDRFTEEEMDVMEYDIDTGNNVVLHWNYTLGKTKYQQTINRANGIITLTPARAVLYRNRN